MPHQVQNILILEDNQDDVLLIKRQAKKAFPDATFTVAVDRESFLKKITWMSPGLVLSDYNLPDYNGLEALLYCRENLPQVPFVFVTGVLDSQEKAAEAILNGAAGYILKDNLRHMEDRLPEIVKRFRNNLSTAELIRDKLNRAKLISQKIEAKLDGNQIDDSKSLIKQLRSILSEKI